MDIQIISKHFHPDERLEEYVRDKSQRLDRYLPTISKARIELSKEETKAAKDRAVVQVTLNCNGTLLRGQERAVDHFKAVDSVAGVLQRQTQRLKAKLYRAEQRGLKASEQLAPPLSMEEEPLGQVVRKKRFVMQSMSPEEAILEMELVGHGFFMFLNSKTQEHNVVYRRSGGDYGLIEPEAL